jgi:integrase
LNDHRLYDRFKRAAIRAGLPAMTVHDLRHTGASLMIASGTHVRVIAEQMGHSDGGALVLRRYGHLYKGAQKQAALALEPQRTLKRRRCTGGGWNATVLARNARLSGLELTRFR